MANYLIVIDMQRDFVTGALGSVQAQDIVPAVAARIRAAHEAGETVIFTLDTHEEGYLSTREGKYLPVAHCIRNTPGWTLEPAIAAECKPGMISFEKPTFGSAALARHMEKQAQALASENGRGMTIELCGVCTDICVVSNAMLLCAALPEAEIVVDPSLCAGTTVENHEAALATMRSCQVQVK